MKQELKELGWFAAWLAPMVSAGLFVSGHVILGLLGVLLYAVGVAVSGGWEEKPTGPKEPRIGGPFDADGQ